MGAGAPGLGFLADASAFPSDYSFLFATGVVKDLGAAEPEGFLVGACLGDLLGEGKTFTGEGHLDGLLRMARWSYMGISSRASSLDDSSDELEMTFFDFLTMLFFQ